MRGARWSDSAEREAVTLPHVRATENDEFTCVPQGAIVVNVIDHTPVKKVENDLEAEPAGGLLPPDWAQHMGANLPPAEPIDSPDANPKARPPSQSSTA